MERETSVDLIMCVILMCVWIMADYDYSEINLIMHLRKKQNDRFKTQTAVSYIYII